MKSLDITLFFLSLIFVYFCSGSEILGVSDDEMWTEKRKADRMSVEEGVECHSHKKTKAVADNVNSEEGQSFADFADPMIRNQFATSTRNSSSSSGPLPTPSEFAPGTPASTSQSFSAVESPGSVYSATSLHSATNSMIEEYAERMNSPIGRKVTVESDDSEGSDDDLRIGLIDHPNRNNEEDEDEEENNDNIEAQDSSDWDYYFSNLGATNK